EALAPYLAEIDAARYYANFGPLVRRFQDRLGGTIRFRAEGGGVVTCANATLGLAAALMAQGGGAGELCMVPAWTFVASPLAARLAGMVPYFVDVDATSWELHPAAAERAVARAPGRVGAVMPVAPFGSPVSAAGWDEFQTATGLPVVIDAAGGFDGLEVGSVPAVVSLHAANMPGVGAGRLLASTNPAPVPR